MTINDNRKKLLTIIAWFFIPLAIAFSWYKLLPAAYHPMASTNNGDLLTPIFTLAPFEHKTHKGETFSNANIEKVWTLVQFVNGDCDEHCSRSLYNTRQMRISFGKDIKRINRLAVFNPSGQADGNQKMWASHPDLKVVIATERGVGAQIKAQLDEAYLKNNALYLVDPLGNVMMHFPASLETKLIKKDIRKLLKLSHIG